MLLKCVVGALILAFSLCKDGSCGGNSYPVFYTLTCFRQSRLLQWNHCIARGLLYALHFEVRFVVVALVHIALINLAIIKLVLLVRRIKPTLLRLRVTNGTLVPGHRVIATAFWCELVQLVFFFVGFLILVAVTAVFLICPFRNPCCFHYCHLTWPLVRNEKAFLQNTSIRSNVWCRLSRSDRTCGSSWQAQTV
ncbi:MAG: hypothetical protein BYD32DRAFT_406078 [Podila humilis]|nr:MAG: hypothetical protein BYD32DRAFT_406078 [Podila humilis]